MFIHLYLFRQFYAHWVKEEHHKSCKMIHIMMDVIPVYKQTYIKSKVRPGNDFMSLFSL
jgi:hypothetical protein